VYFKRELPLDRFFSFRLFESELGREERSEFAEKLSPCWLSYDRDFVRCFTDILIGA
jgi:hypothetical protein